MLAALLNFVNADFNIAEIVQSIEDPEDIHAVLCSLAAEETYYVIRIVLVAEDVLAADEHL